MAARHSVHGTMPGINHTSRLCGHAVPKGKVVACMHSAYMTTLASAPSWSTKMGLA